MGHFIINNDSFISSSTVVQPVSNPVGFKGEAQGEAAGPFGVNGCVRPAGASTLTAAGGGLSPPLSEQPKPGGQKDQRSQLQLGQPGAGAVRCAHLPKT